MLHKTGSVIKNALVSISGFSAIICLFMLIFSYSVSAEAYDQVLAKVDILSSISSIPFPVYAHLQGASGKEYALVIAGQRELGRSSIAYKVLDEIPEDMQGTNYLICLERLKGARNEAALRFNVLLDDGRNILIRVTGAEAEELVKLGFEIELLSKRPIITEPRQRIQQAEQGMEITYNRTIANMMNRVTESKAYEYISGLAGETPVTIGDTSYKILSRNTNSGIHIQNATRYIYEFMLKAGLSVSYQNWSYSYYSGRNVIGEKAGTVSPEEIILVTAHLDCMPPLGNAPGADDNGSGSVAAMIIAEMFAKRSFERTIRFVFFTGEEQGLIGSSFYADKVLTDKDNIVGVYNMDMIAWDSIGGPTLRLHTRSRLNPGYTGDNFLAATFVNVLNVYGLNSALTPIIDPDGIAGSDHSSFWNIGVPAILAIEDDEDDFCINYHTSYDTVLTLNFAYFTSYIKVSLGMAAHLAKMVNVNKPDINPAIDLLLNSD